MRLEIYNRNKEFNIMNYTHCDPINICTRNSALCHISLIGRVMRPCLKAVKCLVRGGRTTHSLCPEQVCSRYYCDSVGRVGK